MSAIQKSRLSFAALRGVLSRPVKARSVKEMNESILDAAAARFNSSVNQHGHGHRISKTKRTPNQD